MPPLVDITHLDEDARIHLIGKRATEQNQTVAFMVDIDNGDHSKGDRYVEKLCKWYPGVKVTFRGDGPVLSVETIKVSVIH